MARGEDQTVVRNVAVFDRCQGCPLDSLQQTWDIPAIGSDDLAARLNFAVVDHFGVFHQLIEAAEGPDEWILHLAFDRQLIDVQDLIEAVTADVTDEGEGLVLGQSFHGPVEQRSIASAEVRIALAGSQRTDLAFRPSPRR